MIIVPAVQHPATALLADLGTNRHQVAATLTQHGYRGERGDCLACPVAVYLLTSLPGLAQVLVGDTEAELLYADGREEFIDLTDAVTDFISAFDNGMYDQLLAGVRA